MQRGLAIDWNKLNQVECETLQGCAARQKAEELGLDIIDEIQEAIKLANNSYALKTHLNPSRPMARWGDIVEHFALMLIPKGWEQRKIHRQACLVNPNGKIRIILMSPNDALGQESEIITASYAKGIATKLKLLANTSHYNNHQSVRTFILYYQPCSQIEQSDNDWLPFEIAYATAIYEVKPNASKKEYFPSNHTLRLMFVNEDGLESYKVPIPDEGNDITENDFEALQAI